MRFLSMIRHAENTGQVPSEQLMTDMGKLIWMGRSSAPRLEGHRRDEAAHRDGPARGAPA